jgi:Clp amino terminal domain, pathogenicity island component
MFQGDHPELRQAVIGALTAARDLGHPRAGSEHLLLGLSAIGTSVSAVLARHGATEAALRDAADQAAPLGAGAAADREVLVALGIDAARRYQRTTRRPVTAGGAVVSLIHGWHPGHPHRHAQASHGLLRQLAMPRPLYLYGFQRLCTGDSGEGNRPQTAVQPGAGDGGQGPYRRWQ